MSAHLCFWALIPSDTVSIISAFVTIFQLLATSRKIRIFKIQNTKRVTNAETIHHLLDSIEKQHDQFV